MRRHAALLQVLGFVSPSVHSSDLSRQISTKAIALLARREHSEKELRTKLLRVFKDHDALVQGVIEQLKHDDYLSDRRFAACYIRSRANRGFGPERILLELGAKGVDSSSGLDALQELEQTELNWSAVIERVWRKKFSDPPADFGQKFKQTRFLQYRGFSLEQIAALEAVWDGEPE